MQHGPGLRRHPLDASEYADVAHARFARVVASSPGVHARVIPGTGEGPRG